MGGGGGGGRIQRKERAKQKMYSDVLTEAAIVL